MSSVKQYIKNPKFGKGDEPEFLPVGTTGIDAVKNRLLQVERQALNITIRDKKNYASLTEAIAAVTDDKYKVKGFQLQFSIDGKVWKHYLYNGDDASGWSSEDNWLEVTYDEGGSSNQYLDLSMFSEESGTLSDENYQNVINAYENNIITGLVDGRVIPLTIAKTGEGSFNIFITQLNNISDIIIACLAIIISKDKNYTANTSSSIQLLTNGSGAKALTDNGKYSEFVPEAPADGKTYGRNNKQWVETSGGTQYLDLSMFSSESGTLSDEDYQKVVKAYEDKIGTASYEPYYGDLYIYERDGNYIILTNILITEGTGVSSYNVSLISVNSLSKSYTSVTQANYKIYTNGSGTKALTDNGQYAEFAKPTKVENGGNGTVTKELQPNTYYQFGECSSLTITLASGTTGYLNEYMFEFVSGTNPSTLTDIPNVKWQNGDKLVPEANCTYQVSIVNNCAVYAKFPNA